MKNTNQKKNIYLDHASATPIEPRVLAVFQKVSKECYANPSALHMLGVRAHNYLEDARKKITDTIGAHSDEVVFVSGATESDNLALLGTVRTFKKNHPNIRPHIVVSAIEHAAVVATSEWLVREGIEVSVLPVDQDGFVSPKDLRKILRPETVLVSVMYVNNEIGTIQPITEIAKEIRHFRKMQTKNHGVKNSAYPLFHTDATQALNYLPVNVEKLGVDLLSFNGSKLYGPKGIGALYVKRKTPIESILFGGDQEFGLRPGTESVSTICAFAEAARYANAIREKESKRLIKLRDQCIEKILQLPHDIRINGSVENRLPNNINFTVNGYGSDLVVLYLDAQGVFVSSKSACKSTDPESSHVIRALGYNDPGDTGSVRMTLGRGTTKQDLDYTVRALAHVLQLLNKKV